MSEKHIKELLRTFLHAQDHVSLLHMVSRSQDYVDEKIKKRDVAHDAIMEEFAALRQQRDELAEALESMGSDLASTEEADDGKML